MNIVKYIREKGIRRALEVFYKYKLQIILNRGFLLFLIRRPLRDIIIIESHDDFDCNGGAFYDYLIQNGYNKRYKVVWLLKYRLDRKLPENVAAVPLYKPGIRKAYYICMAKWFLADNVVTEKVRADQLSIYLTHGAVGLKNVRGLSTLPESVDYVLSPSQFWDQYLKCLLGIENTGKQLLHLGYPCDDVFYQKTDNELVKLTENTYFKVVLWMPTFRKGGGYERNDSSQEQELGIPLFHTMEQLLELNKFLRNRSMALILKLHPKQDLSSFCLTDFSNIFVVTGKRMKELGMNTYRLYKAVDAIISDYSSAAYDFLFTGRPIAYEFSDLTSYKIGLIVDQPDELMAGPTILTPEDFRTFLDCVARGEDSYGMRREELRRKLYAFSDGNSSGRLADFMGLKPAEAGGLEYK